MPTLFRKLIFMFILSLFFKTTGFSFVIIDFADCRYEDVLSNFYKVENLPLDGIIVGAPFKTYENRKKEDLVYDFFDEGNIFQRGSLETYYGSRENFQNLIDFIREKKIKIYSKVNLFTQKKGYKRSFWKNSDFYSLSMAYSDVYYININNVLTRDKLNKIVARLFFLPVDRWIIDIRNYPESLQKEYYNYLSGQDNSRLYILSEVNKSKDILSSEDYWFLREKVFVPQNCKFSILKEFSFRDNKIHLIESEETSINNFCVLAYLLSQNQNVVVPVDMLNSYGLQVVRFFGKGRKMRLNVISDDKFLIYDDAGIAAFNLGNFMCMLKMENTWKRKGVYKSVLGSSPISFEEKDVYMFLLPEIFSFWDLK